MKQSKNQATIEDDRTGEYVSILIRAIAENMFYVHEKFPRRLSKNLSI